MEASSAQEDGSEGENVLGQAQGLVAYMSDLEVRLDETERRLGDEARAHATTKQRLNDALASHSKLEEQLRSTPIADIQFLHARLEEEIVAHDKTKAALADALLKPGSMQAALLECQENLKAAKMQLEQEVRIHAETQAALEDALLKLQGTQMAGFEDIPQMKNFQVLQTMLTEESNAHALTRRDLHEAMLKLEEQRLALGNGRDMNPRQSEVAVQVDAAVKAEKEEPVVSSPSVAHESRDRDEELKQSPAVATRGCDETVERLKEEFPPLDTIIAPPEDAQSYDGERPTRLDTADPRQIVVDYLAIAPTSTDMGVDMANALLHFLKDEENGFPYKADFEQTGGDEHRSYTRETELRARMKFLEDLCKTLWEALQAKYKELQSRVEPRVGIDLEDSSMYSPEQAEAYASYDVVYTELLKLRGELDRLQASPSPDLELPQISDDIEWDILKQERDDLNARVQSLLQQLKEFERNFKQKEGEVKSLREQLKDLDNMNEQTRQNKELEASVNERTRQLEDSESRLKALVERISLAESNLAGAKEDASNTRNKCKELESHRDELLVQLAAAQQRWKVAEDSLAEARLSENDRINKLLGDAQSARAESDRLSSEINRLMGQLSDAERRCGEAGRQLKDVKIDDSTRVAQLLEDAENARSKINELTRALEDALAQLEVAKSRCEDLGEQLAQAKLALSGIDNEQVEQLLAQLAASQTLCRDLERQLAEAKLSESERVNKLLGDAESACAKCTGYTSEVRRLLEQLSEAERDCDELGRRLAGVKPDTNSETRKQLLEDTQKARTKCEDLAGELQKTLTELAIADTASENLQRQLVELNISMTGNDQFKKLLAEVSASREELKRQVNELQAQLAESAQRYEKADLEGAARSHNDAERIKKLLSEVQDAQALRAKCDDLTQQRDDLKRRLEAAEEQRENAERQLSGSNLDQSEHIKKLCDEAAEARRAYNQAMTEFAALQEKYTELAQVMRSKEDLYAENQYELVKLQSALEKEASEVARLKDVEKSLENFGSGASLREQMRQHQKIASMCFASRHVSRLQEFLAFNCFIAWNGFVSSSRHKADLRSRQKKSAMAFACRCISLDVASLLDCYFLVWSRAACPKRSQLKEDAARAEALEEQQRRHAEASLLLRGDFDLAQQRLAETEARMAREMLDEQTALREAKQQAAWQAELTDMKAKANEELMAQLAAAQEQMAQVSQIQSLAEVSARVAESTHEENASVWQQMLQEAERRFEAQLAENKARAAQEEAACQTKLKEAHAVASQEAAVLKVTLNAEMSEIRFEASENRQRDNEEIMAFKTRLSMMEAQQEDLIKLRALEEQARLQARLDAAMENEMRFREELAESKADLDQAKVGAASQIGKLELTLGKILEEKAKLQSQLGQVQAKSSEEAEQLYAELTVHKDQVDKLQSDIERLRILDEERLANTAQAQDEHARLMTELEEMRGSLAAQGSLSDEEANRLKQELTQRAESTAKAENAMQRLKEEACLAEEKYAEEKRLADNAELIAEDLRKEIGNFKEELHRLQSDATAKAEDDVARLKLELEHWRKTAADSESSAQKEMSRLSESLQHYELMAEDQVSGLASLEERSSALRSEVCELEAARDEQSKLRGIAEDLAASLRGHLENETQELKGSVHRHHEARTKLAATERQCEELSQKLQNNEELSLAARAAMLKSSSELVEARSELQSLRNRYAQSSGDSEAIAAEEAAKRQRLREWAKLQRSGIGRRFEFALDRWIVACAFAAWARNAETARLNKISQAAQNRANAAAEAAALDLRRASRTQEEVEHQRAEAERLRRELRELKAKMVEFERLKEVDIKLEIIDREHRIRDLLDQRAERIERPESLPRMPEGDVSTPLRARREIAEQMRPASNTPISQNGSRLPPANHFGRAAEDARSIPSRPHTSMDEHSRARPEWSRTARTSRTSMSPEGKCSSYLTSTPLPPQRPSQQKTPRRGSRKPSSQKQRRNEPADASSDMWAFVNFGQPLTDYVLNTDPPMPKPLRRFISPQETPENTRG